MHASTGHSFRRRGRFATAVLAGITACTMTVVAPGVGGASTVPDVDDPVTRWANRHAVSVPAADRPGADLARLHRATRHARIVGLGEAAHNLAEITDLKRRAVEFLVTKRGFRSIAWEDDWTLGILVNDYIQGRRDDRDVLVGQLSPAWRTQEVADLLTWLREYNRTHRDDVRFVGVEYFATRPLAYDAVDGYVAEHAPERLAEVREQLRMLEPEDDDMGAHLDWYTDPEQVEDQRPYVRNARRLHDLVASIPHRRGDLEHALALQHARQIRSWYVGFSLPVEDIFDHRDARAADNLRWWQRHTGDKIVYWAHAAHAADAPALTITPFPATPFASVGSFLDDWYGDRYVTVGYTFDRGSRVHQPGEPAQQLPPAADEWFEAPLGDVDRSQFVLDLDRRTPPAVQEWLRTTMLTRGYPEAGLSSTMSGGTLADWFDVLVHRQEVSPATPLVPRTPA